MGVKVLGAVEGLLDFTRGPFSSIYDPTQVDKACEDFSISGDSGNSNILQIYNQYQVWGL